MTDISQSKLFVNCKLQIIENQETYICMVQDIKDKGIIINVPISGNKYYNMHPGKTIEFYAIINKECFRYSAIVLGKRREGNLEFILLTVPEVLERIQRREYFRQTVLMDVKYKLLPEGKTYTQIKNLPKSYFEDMIKASTLDMSGGGMKIITSQGIPRGRFLVINLCIPEEIDLLGVVTRSDEDKIHKKFRIGLKFVGVDVKTREKIIRFIFAIAREHAKSSK
jgi:c-di-GMP-binding flagellar brake protein YcgR